MDKYDPSLAARFATLLNQRMAELSALLQSENPLAGTADAASHDVVDFKDVAGSASRAAVDDLQSAHAAHELEQVLTARRRLKDNSYGFCLDCGEPIDLRRLTALPATPYCTACQTLSEQERPAARR